MTEDLSVQEIYQYLRESDDKILETMEKIVT